MVSWPLVKWDIVFIDFKNKFTLEILTRMSNIKKTYMDLLKKKKIGFWVSTAESN